MSLPLRIIHHVGAAAAAIVFGKRLLPRSSPTAVDMPGAFVWQGRDHDLRDGRFIPTRLAWGRGEEPMAPLVESDAFPSTGLDERDNFDDI